MCVSSRPLLRRPTDQPGQGIEYRPVAPVDPRPGAGTYASFLGTLPAPAAPFLSGSLGQASSAATPGRSLKRALASREAVFRRRYLIEAAAEPLTVIGKVAGGWYEVKAYGDNGLTRVLPFQRGEALPLEEAPG